MLDNDLTKEQNEKMEKVFDPAFSLAVESYIKGVTDGDYKPELDDDDSDDDDYEDDDDIDDDDIDEDDDIEYVSTSGSSSASSYDRYDKYGRYGKYGQSSKIDDLEELDDDDEDVDDLLAGLGTSSSSRHNFLEGYRDKRLNGAMANCTSALELSDDDDDDDDGEKKKEEEEKLPYHKVEIVIKDAYNYTCGIVKPQPEKPRPVYQRVKKTKKKYEPCPYGEAYQHLCYYCKYNFRFAHKIKEEPIYSTSDDSDCSLVEDPNRIRPF